MTNSLRMPQLYASAQKLPKLALRRGARREEGGGTMPMVPKIATYSARSAGSSMRGLTVAALGWIEAMSEFDRG